MSALSTIAEIAAEAVAAVAGDAAPAPTAGARASDLVAFVGAMSGMNWTAIAGAVSSGFANLGDDLVAAEDVAGLVAPLLPAGAEVALAAELAPVALPLLFRAFAASAANAAAAAASATVPEPGVPADSRGR